VQVRQPNMHRAKHFGIRTDSFDTIKPVEHSRAPLMNLVRRGQLGQVVAFMLKGFGRDQLGFSLPSGFPRGPGAAPQRAPSPRWSGQAATRL